jgi:hypothetical protein
MREDTGGEWEERLQEMVFWKCSRHGVRSGQGGLRVFQVWLKSGGVPALLGRSIISIWARRWRSQVLSVKSPECVEVEFSEVVPSLIQTTPRA